MEGRGFGGDGRRPQMATLWSESRVVFNKGIAYHEERPERIVQENSRGSYEHSHAHEFVQLRTWKSVLCMQIRVTWEESLPSRSESVMSCAVSMPGCLSRDVL